MVAQLIYPAPPKCTVMYTVLPIMCTTKALYTNKMYTQSAIMQMMQRCYHLPWVVLLDVHIMLNSSFNPIEDIFDQQILFKQHVCLSRKK